MIDYNNHISQFYNKTFSSFNHKSCYIQVNGLSAFLSAFNLFLYTCVYTPLKRVRNEA